MLDYNMPPHITLAMWDSESSYKDEIGCYVKGISRFEVMFNSLGIFNSDEQIAHIFLAPVKNRALTNLQNELYDHITLKDDEEFDIVYKDNDFWVPHATIGYQVNPKKLSNAVKKCSDIMFPQTAVVEKIALASCCPFKEIAVFNLQK
jgi:2'-5' RNA ligase